MEVTYAEPMGLTQKLLSKLYASAIGAVTTIATQRLLKAGWKFATGKEPPSPSDPDASLITALSWAIASAVGVAVTQLLTQRMLTRRPEREIGNDSHDDGRVSVKI
jgi:cytoskeletal protein RodZ